MNDPGSLARWALLWRLVLALSSFSSLTGCSFISMKQTGLENTLRTAGLRPAERRFGPDFVHYWAGGEGPTVVLVHGFGASAIWQWSEQAEDLARDHRVIVPDLLWFGGSSSDDRDFGIDHQVRALEALLDKLGERSFDVVGISYGGLVAHELAGDRPDEVRNLVLADTPGRVYTREDYQALCARLGVKAVSEVLVPRDEAGIRRLLGLAYHDPPWAPDFALHQAMGELYSTHREERIALLESLLGDMDALKARPVTLKARTLVVWGRDDPVFPLAIGERLAEALGAKIEIVEEANHTPNLEHPEEFNRIVRGFLAEGGEPIR